MSFQGYNFLKDVLARDAGIRDLKSQPLDQDLPSQLGQSVQIWNPLVVDELILFLADLELACG